MSSSTLVKDVLYRVSVQLQDTNPQFTRWTQRELVVWLNDGQKAIAKYLPPACTRVDAVKLSPGTKQSIDKILAANIKPGDGSTAADVYGLMLQDVIRTMGSDGLTPGTSIRLVDREILDVNNPTWHSTTGTPSQYTFDPRAPRVFYVCPGVPAATATWVEISYMAQPTDITVPANTSQYGMDGNDPTVISIADKFVDDLVNYILARAYMKDAEFSGDDKKASEHAEMFTGSINAQSAAMTGVNPNLRGLPMNPNLPRRQAA